MDRFFGCITEPRYAAYVFAAALLIVHGLLPMGVDTLVDDNPYMRQMATMVIVTSIIIVVSRHIPMFDFQFRRDALRLPINERMFQFGVWGVFVAFLIVTLWTAPSIPLWSSLFGSFTANELEDQRGAFLKTREGWQAALPYVGAVFAGTLLPFALARLFLNRAPSRWVAFGTFIFYSMSHLQKALFIQVVTPLGYLAARRIIWTYLGLVALIIGSIALIYVNTVLARGVQDENEVWRHLQQRRALARSLSTSDNPKLLQNIVPPEFFSADFRPTSAAEHMIWRIISVPIFTASDALVVHERQFDGRHLHGATSSLVSAIFGLDRVNFDAEVHGYQWGDKIRGRSNSVFVTDGYINFGWFGVIIYAVFVGQTFRWFALAKDEAFRSMWPLWAFNIAQASLIGSLLSSGFALLFAIALFARSTEMQNVKR